MGKNYIHGGYYKNCHIKRTFFGKLKLRSNWGEHIKDVDRTTVYDISFLGESGSTTKKKGGIVRAVAGGAMFGGVGAIVGSSTAKSKTKVDGYNVCITFNDGTKAMFTADEFVFNELMNI